MLTRATVVPLPVRMTFSHSLQSPCVESQVNSYLGDFAAAEEKVLRCSSGLFGWVQTELAFAAADVECEVGRARKRRPSRQNVWQFWQFWLCSFCTCRPQHALSNVEEHCLQTLKNHVYIHTYLPTYIHTYLPTYLHTYIHTYII